MESNSPANSHVEVKNSPTIDNLQCNSWPIKPNPNRLTGVLNDIPFVLNERIVHIPDITTELEPIRLHLKTLKEKLDSDVYSYDFSKEKKKK